MSGVPVGAPPASAATPQPEYVQAVYDRVIAWYDDAEGKARLILTLDGIFLSFVSTSVFRKSADLRPITRHFGPETWVFLSLMAMSLTISVVSAVVALRSRMYSKRKLKADLANLGVKPAMASTYVPAVTFFFQHLAVLEPFALGDRFATTDAQLAARTLGENVVKLADNVVHKHRWVNRGFLFAGAVLVFFLAAVVSYLVRTS